VLSLPEVGPAPDDDRVQLILQPLSRVAVSYRNGLWNKADAAILPLTLATLERTVFERQGPIYGWKFFNTSVEEDFAPWSHRLSLDVEFEGRRGQAENTLNLSQDNDPYLEIRIWFGELRIFDPNRNEMSLESFIAGGRRWWDGLYSGDERTRGAGIVLLKSDREE